MMHMTIHDKLINGLNKIANEFNIRVFCNGTLYPKENKMKTINYSDMEMRVAADLIHIIECELKRGTKHYRKSDKQLLTTAKEILITMQDEGSIEIDPPLPKNKWRCCGIEHSIYNNCSVCGEKYED